MISILFIGIFALAKPFTIQHFTDERGDLESTVHHDDPACNETKLRIPDIIGVSYSSDGQILNGTLWLDQPFGDPSHTNVTIYVINITNAIQADSVKNSHISIQNNKIKLRDVYGGIRNDSLSPILNYTTGDGSLMYLEKKKPVYYIVIFDTNRELFKSYWPKAKKIFDSFFNLVDAQNRTVTLTNQSEINITDIQYLPDWFQSSNPPTYAIAKFLPSDPFWLFVKYATTVQVISSPSFGRSDADYKYTVSWNGPANKWSTTLEQLSGYGKNLTKQQNRVIFEKDVGTPDFSNSNGGGSHVETFIRLKDIGSPDNYAVFSNVYSQFARPGVDGKRMVCYEIDNTNWVPLPPPKIDLTISPSSLTLSPGEEKIIQVRANSSTSVPAKISFRSTSDPLLNLNYSPQTLYLSSFGKGSSTLRVSAPDNLLDNSRSSKELPLHIVGTVEFPIGFIITTTGVVYKSTQAENINTSAYAYISVLTEHERSMRQITEVYNMASSSIQELSLVIAAVVGIVSPISIIWKNKSIRKKTVAACQQLERPEYKWVYFAAAPITAIAGYLMIMLALLGVSTNISVYILILGLLQFSFMIPFLIKSRKGYFIGVIGTAIIVTFNLLISPFDETILVIVGLQILYAILSVIIIAKDKGKPLIETKNR